eukprot:Clim_evm8s216 gene=Clim_evmTU8s216
MVFSAITNWLIGYNSSNAALSRSAESFRERMRTSGDVDTMVTIIGSGFSGICMSIKLKEAGVPHIVLEKEDDLGGTWYKNTYPGCQCDVPSILYSFSFYQKPDWTRVFAEQPEILEYIRDTVDHFGIKSHFKFGKKVNSCVWDESKNLWNVHCADGSSYVSKYLVRAVGGLDTPSFPQFKNREAFQGPNFHSAQWDHSVDLTDKRVAVVGNAASCIQFTPIIANYVKSLDIYQRTAHWIAPRPDREVYGIEKWLCRYLPGYMTISRFFTYIIREFRFWLVFYKDTWMSRWVRKQLSGMISGFMTQKPEYTEKLVPAYQPGCKRFLLGVDYYDMLNKEQVSLITDPIVEGDATGLITKDGTKREYDVIIYATGFKILDWEREHVKGREGAPLVPDGESPQAFMGLYFAKHPNLFTLLGPNTGLGHNSIILMIESQVSNVMGVLRNAEQVGAKTIEIKPEVITKWCEHVDSHFNNKVWTTCDSWYRDPNGKVSALYSRNTYWYFLACKTNAHLDNFTVRV